MTFEQAISLCLNFQDNLISYIPFIWKSFIRIWDESCSNLWNFGPFDMQRPTSNIGKWDFLSTIFQCPKSHHLEYCAPWILFKQPQFCLWNWERLNDFDRNYQNLKKLPQYQNNLWNNYKWDFHCIYILYSKVPKNPTIKQQKIWSPELGNTRSLWKIFKYKNIWITPTILGNRKFILL